MFHLYNDIFFPKSVFKIAAQYLYEAYVCSIKLSFSFSNLNLGKSKHMSFNLNYHGMFFTPSYLVFLC